MSKKINLFRQISALEERRLRVIMKHDGGWHLGIVRALELKIEALKARAVAA